MNEQYRAYALKFLEQERASLATEPHSASPSGDAQYVFSSSSPISEVERKFMEIMNIVNRIGADIPDGIDLIIDEAEIARVDTKWRRQLWRQETYRLSE